MSSIDDITLPRGEYNVDVYRMFKEAYTCTEEDLKFQFTTEQLKQICLKHKCQVMASRWNVAFEYGLWLRKEGRFNGKSACYERRMITKGVNRHKHLILYDEEEIQKTLVDEWQLRKKDNILSVRLWERERKQQNASDESVVETDDLSVLSRNSDSGGEQQTVLETNIETDSQRTENMIDMMSHDSFTIVDDCGAVEDVYDIDSASKVNIELMDNLDNSKGINNNIREMFDINTESMTVSHYTETFSQNPSQDIFSQDFNKELPCTSTQKETEEIEVLAGI